MKPPTLKRQARKRHLRACSDALGDRCVRASHRCRPICHLWVNRETQRIKPKFVDRALLRLHVYSDHRLPDALTAENIFRWYHLRQGIVTVTPNGKKQAAFPMTTLFVTFEPEVRVSTLKVQSPDIALPAHEVKEFNQRFAIITFMGELTAGTLVVSVQP